MSPWIPLDLIGPVMVEQAKKATVPVCVYLDHGETLSYLEKALSIGFAGIMYDGSVLPYEENLANTKQAVTLVMHGGSEAADYVNGLSAKEPVFFSSISMRAREAMKENVTAAMKMFALSYSI